MIALYNVLKERQLYPLLAPAKAENLQSRSLTQSLSTRQPEDGTRDCSETCKYNGLLQGHQTPHMRVRAFLLTLKRIILFRSTGCFLYRQTRRLDVRYSRI